MQLIHDHFAALCVALEEAGLREHVAALRDAEVAFADVAGAQQSAALAFDCYSDADERVASTLDEYVRQLGLVVGDEFEVTAGFSRQERYVISGGGPTIRDPAAAFRFDPAEPARDQATSEHPLLIASTTFTDDLPFLAGLAHWGATRFGNPNPFTARLRIIMRQIRSHSRPTNSDTNAGCGT